MKSTYLKDPPYSERQDSPWSLIEAETNPWVSSSHLGSQRFEKSPSHFPVFSYSTIAKLIVVNLILVALIVQTKALYRIEAGVEPSPKLTQADVSLEAAALSTGNLEERFQKISTVLSYLLNQRTSAPLPGSVAEGELPVATITADKAYLRSGPGKEHSPVMAMSRGTRLVVERQEGNWYQVTGPTGQRLWAAGEVLEVENG